MNLPALSPALKAATGLAVGAAFAGAVALTATHGGGGPRPAFNAGTIDVTPTAFVEKRTTVPGTGGLEAHPTVPAPPTATPELKPTPASFSCPDTWTRQDNVYLHYLFCTPPGWVVLRRAVGPVGPVPTPASGQPIPTGLPGSQMQIYNPQQAKLAGTPRDEMIPGGILINVYLMEILPSSDLKIFPPCSGALDVVAGLAVTSCSPQSTRVPPLRTQSWRATAPGKFLFMADILIDPAAATSEEDLARQVVKSIEFY